MPRTGARRPRWWPSSVLRRRQQHQPRAVRGRPRHGQGAAGGVVRHGVAAGAPRHPLVAGARRRRLHRLRLSARGARLSRSRQHDSAAAGGHCRTDRMGRPARRRSRAPARRGRIVRDALEGARTRWPDWCGVAGRQVVFTSGATEAINAAVWGPHRRSRGTRSLRRRRALGRARHVGPLRAHRGHQGGRRGAHRRRCAAGAAAPGLRARPCPGALPMGQRRGRHVQPVHEVVGCAEKPASRCTWTPPPLAGTCLWTSARSTPTW